MPVVDHRSTPSPWSVPTNARDLNTSDLDDSGRAPDASDAERARTVICNNRLGVLSVAVGDPPTPCGFVVPYATNEEGIPFVSVRRGIAMTGRLRDGLAVSLTVSETPLTANHSGGNGGVTLLGTLHAVPHPSDEFDNVILEYSRSQPADAAAVKRGTAQLHRLTPSRIFSASTSGDVSRVSVEDYARASSDPLATVAPSLVSHLSGDDNGTLVLLARAYGGQPRASSAQLAGIDQYGMDILVTTPNGRESVRLLFTRPVSTSEEVRQELAAMARGARFKLGVG